MEWIFGLIGLLLGAILAGLTAAYFLSNLRVSLTQKIEETERQSEALRQSNQETLIRNAGLETELAALESLKQELTAARDDLVQLTAQRSALEGQLQEQQRAYEAWKLERAELEAKLKEEFQGLASEALRKNTTSFLEMANDKLKEGEKDLDAKQKSIEELVKPIAESLQKVDEQVKEIEKSRVGAYNGLLSQVELLRGQSERLNKETTTLAQALKGSSTRGRWGEIQLKRIAEVHGMLEYCDFVLQTSGEDDDGNRKRPDMIVKLPNDRCLIVDSKVPLDDLLDTGDSDDELLRTDRVVELSKRVKGHILALRSRNYAELKHSPDFVVMFMPSPRLLDLALEGDPSLLEFAYERDVVLATASTLMAVMRSVHFVWKQEKLAKNSQRIADEGRRLHKGIANFVTNFEAVGKAIGTAQEKHNVALGHLRKSILPSAGRLEIMSSSGKTIPGIEVGIVEEALVELPGASEALFGLSDLDQEETETD